MTNWTTGLPKKPASADPIPARIGSIRLGSCLRCGHGRWIGRQSSIDLLGARPPIRRSVAGVGSQTRAAEPLDGCISALVTGLASEKPAHEENDRADDHDPD